MSGTPEQPHNVPQDTLLVCQAVAVCVVLQQYSIEMCGGGEFKVVDIADHINGLAWPRQTSYVVDPHFLGHGLKLFLKTKGGLLSRHGWTLSGTKDVGSANFVLGINDIGHCYGFRVNMTDTSMKRLRKDTDTDVSTSVRVAAQFQNDADVENVAKEIATLTSVLLEDLGYDPVRAMMIDAGFLLRYNRSVERMDGTNRQCNDAVQRFLEGPGQPQEARTHGDAGH